MPGITVIMPVFETDGMQRALASLRAQTVDDWELIVVDDGSPDTVDATSLRSEAGARIVRHGENRGLGAALNTGLDHARGDLIAYLPVDDAWLPDHLATLLRGARSRHGAPLAAVGHAGTNAHWPERDELETDDLVAEWRGGDSPLLLLRGWRWCGCPDAGAAAVAGRRAGDLPAPLSGLAARGIGVDFRTDVEPADWVTELSRYGAGWLHPARASEWDDLNLPARIPSLVAAGLPLIVPAPPPGAIHAASRLARELGCGVLYSDLDDLAAQLQDTSVQRAAAWRARETLTFDHHADRLVEVLRRASASCR